MKQLTPELCVCTGSSWIIHVHQSLLSPTQSKPSWRLDSIADFIHLFPYQTGSYLPGVDFPWRFCWIMCPVWILWMIVVGRARPRALSFSFFCSLSHPVWLTGRLDSINKLGSTRNNCMRVCVHACPCGNHLKSLTCLSCLHIEANISWLFPFWVFHRVHFSDFNNGALRAAGVCVYYKWVSMSGACPRCPTCVISWNLRISQTDRSSFSVSSSLFSFWEDSDSFQDGC